MRTHEIEPQTLALVIGFGIGLGLVVHEVFFLVAAGAIVIAAGQAVAHHRHT